MDEGDTSVLNCYEIKDVFIFKKNMLHFVYTKYSFDFRVKCFLRKLININLLMKSFCDFSVIWIAVMLEFILGGRGRAEAFWTGPDRARTDTSAEMLIWKCVDEG